jgi:hypothetical protein
MAGRKACSGLRAVKLIDRRNTLISKAIGGSEAFGTGGVGDGEEARVC